MEKKIEGWSADEAAQKVLKKAVEEGVETVWDRRESMRSCAIVKREFAVGFV